LGQGDSGTPDGITLATGGTDHLNLTVWLNGNPDVPNSQDGGASGSGSSSATDQSANASPADGPPAGGVPNPPANPPQVTDVRDAWGLGWKFLKGTAPTTTAYYSNSQWTQDVANSAGAQAARTSVIFNLVNGATLGTTGVYHYSLGGISGLGVFMSDMGHVGGWATGGYYRDPEYHTSYFNVAFLGSFDVTWTIIGIDAANHQALVKFVVSNLDHRRIGN